MAWKILLALIFDGATGKTVQMFVRNVEPGMVKFTNDWYLFHRDSKFVIKNLVEGITYETSDDMDDPINPDMIKAIIRILNEELGYHVNTEAHTPAVTEAVVDPDLGKTSESAFNDETEKQMSADELNEAGVPTPDTVQNPEDTKPGVELVTNEAGTFPSAITPRMGLTDEEEAARPELMTVQEAEEAKAKIYAASSNQDKAKMTKALKASQKNK